METNRYFSHKIAQIIRIGLGLGLVLAVLVSIALIVLLTRATSNTDGFSERFTLLLSLTISLGVVVFGWVVYLLIQLYRQLKQHQFGSRLTARFSFAYAAMAIIPGVLIYLISVQYITRSVDSWFNVKVDSALQAGLNIGQSLLDEQVGNLKRQALRLSNALDQVSNADLLNQLIRIRENSGITADAMIFSLPGNKVLAFSSPDFGRLLEPLPPTSVLNQLRVARQYARAEVMDAHDGSAPIMQIRVIVPLLSRQLNSDTMLGTSNIETYWLQLTTQVPTYLTYNLTSIQNGFRDYEELSLSRQGIRKIYTVTLSFALILTAFLAVAVALTIARRLVRPLLILAYGTHEVAKGNYELLPENNSKDEIMQLTKDFNQMVEQLDNASQLVESNRRQLEKSNLYLESILEGLSSGVIVFDHELKVTIVNQEAARILCQDLSNLPGHTLHAIHGLQDFTTAVYKAFSLHHSTDSEQEYWHEQIEITLVDMETGEPAQTVTTLLIHGTDLIVDHQHGYLLVFDDISDVIAANRVVAWGEVARRLAHEIKNPLTPIQLAAERLLLRLQSKLSDAKDVELLERLVGTIVNQVGSLSRMVEDFRMYAKSPTKRQMQPVDLNALIVDVASLYGWDPQSMPNNVAQQIELNLAEGLPSVQGDAYQLRQVLNNLLTNARDALHGMVLDHSQAGVSIETRYDDSRQTVMLAVSDRGSGFSESIINKAFEPYVTSKDHGTGLGLAIVKKIIDEHGGKIEISNRPTGGARITILFTNLIYRN